MKILCFPYSIGMKLYLDRRKINYVYYELTKSISYIYICSLLVVILSTR